jgi:hypothetical protein
MAESTGVYVAAWVYVEIDQPESLPNISDEVLRQLAREQYEDEGSIEIDDNATVSRP